MDNALNFEFKSEHRLAICRPRGRLDAHFPSQLLKFLSTQEGLPSEPFNRVLDLTLVTDVQLSSTEIWAYANARRDATAHLSPVRTAIITNDTAETVALVYATLMKDSKIEVRVFDDSISAADWLGVPRESVAHTRHEDIR
jgi:hypothetical protein